MIYVVTTRQELFENNEYQIISVEQSLALLNSLDIVGVDTETSGLSCHKDRLLSLQLGCYDFQVVIDCSTIDVRCYKDYLESNRLFLFHNAKFDLQWLFKYHIVPHNVYDLFLAEKLMWLGYPVKLSPDIWDKIQHPRYDYVPADPKKKGSKPSYVMFMNLKKLGEMYLGVELDKSIRGQIIYKGLVGEVINYAATDVKYLEKIRECQLKQLSKQGLLKAMEYENKAILPIAYMCYCGVKMDIERWKKKIARDKGTLDDIKDEMDRWLINNEPDSKYIKINKQGDLFDGFDSSPKVFINWNSQKQVLPIFKKYGVDTSKIDKDTKEDKDSLNAKVLGPQKSKCSLIPLYLRYKEMMKLRSTYGENVLEQIDKKTGRLYTNFNSLGTDTARISSGGKDKAVGIEYVNMLNMPADAETRACFIAETGNRWISIDYSGQETYILADISNDKAIIEDLTNGSGDIHSLTAYMSYPEIPRDTPIKEIKKKYHKLRNEAKRIEFAINYGGDANTISSNSGIPLEEAKKIYNSYMNGFKGIKKYQDFCRKDVMEKGFISLNPKVGYKAYIYDFSYLCKIRDKFSEPGFWDYYREMKIEAPDCDTVHRVKEYFRRKADSEKQSINYRIQHTGALCYKVSMINFFEYLRQNDLLFKVLITVTPYDEINCEAPEAIAENVATILYDIMVKSGAYFVKRVKLDADISRHKVCTKDLYLEGKKIFGASDIIATMGEDTLVNLNTEMSYLVSDLPVDFRDYLDDNGPLPTYWVH
jgi:DNA polymerase I-like protein with 3'-5' exonuclease and polymerase domains